jgi:hypothetical protein
LLLIAPFYDHCNGNRMKEVATTEEVMSDTTAVEMADIKKSNSIAEEDTIINTEKYRPSIFQNIYVFIDDANSENAFEIALINGVF